MHTTPAFDDRPRGPQPWEPEPLWMPAEVPRLPERERDRRDDLEEPDDAEGPGAVVVIDLC